MAAHQPVHAVLWKPAGHMAMVGRETSGARTLTVKSNTLLARWKNPAADAYERGLAFGGRMHGSRQPYGDVYTRRSTRFLEQA